MHRRGLAAAALAALTVGAAPVHADPPNDARVDSNCSFSATQQVDVTGPDRWFGEIRGYAVAYSATPAHDPVTVTAMRCVLSVDGVPAVTVAARTAGPLAVLEPTPIEYTAQTYSWVELCAYVDTVDAHGQTASYVDCGYGDPQWPPQGLIDALDGVWAGTLDPLVCPVLASLAPAEVGDQLRVDPGGDVYVAGELYYDCPPYSPPYSA